MNCHQILSGACNAGDRCFAVGSVEGIPFTVCFLLLYFIHFHSPFFFSSRVFRFQFIIIPCSTVCLRICLSGGVNIFVIAVDLFFQVLIKMTTTGERDFMMVAHDTRYRKQKKRKKKFLVRPEKKWTREKKFFHTLKSVIKSRVFFP